MNEDAFEDDDHENNQKNIQSLINDRLNATKDYADSIKLTKQLVRAFQKQINSTPNEQTEAILQLKAYVLNTNVTPATFTESFLDDFIQLYANKRTNAYIKIDILSLSEDMIKHCIDFIHEFEKRKFYIYIFDDMAVNKSLKVEHCLPVINYFLMHSNIGASYLMNQQIIKFIFMQLENKNINVLTTACLYNSLQAITLTRFSFLDSDDAFKIVDICLDLIIPSQNKKTFIDLETSILVPVVQILANLIKFIPESEPLNKIIKSGVSSFVLTIVTVENFELSFAAINLLCNATYRSDIICLQLRKVGIISELSKCMINTQFYKLCGKLSLRTMYNVLIAFPNEKNTASFLFECMKDSNFISVLHYAITQGTNNEMCTSYLIMGIVIYFSTPDNVLKFVKSLNVLDYLQSMIDSDNNDGSNGALAIAYRLADISQLSIYHNQSLVEFKEIMLTEEMLESLNNYIASHGSSRSIDYATYLINWIQKEGKNQI